MKRSLEWKGVQGAMARRGGGRQGWYRVKRRDKDKESKQGLGNPING